MKLQRIDKKEKLYVMAESGGYSCYGFEVLDRKARALAAEMGEQWTERKGTREAFDHYSRLVEKAREENRGSGRRFECELSPQLIGLEGRRVEVVTTYGEKRRFIVGKSTGFIPCHLEIFRRGSSGGPAADYGYKSVRAL